MAIQRLSIRDVTVLKNPGKLSEQLVWPRNAPESALTITRVTMEPGAVSTRHSHSRAEQIWIVEGWGRGEEARVLERRSRGLRHVVLSRPELIVGVAQVHTDLGQPRLRDGKLLAGLVVLLADLVVLRRELVDPGLNLINSWLRSRTGTRGEDHKSAHRD